MTQLNTPYPATAYLSGFLKSRGYAFAQEDGSIDLALTLFSKTGLQSILREIQKKKLKKPHPSVKFFLKNFDHYIKTITPVISFLQKKNLNLANKIVSKSFLPKGPRFKQQDQLKWAYQELETQDLAKYFASLYIDDLADVIAHAIDDRFLLSRYGEKLAASVGSFDLLNKAIRDSKTLIDRKLDKLAEKYFKEHKPDLVALSVPFPGNVYGAFRIARKLKELSPRLPIALGGGYANTELRNLSEPRVFDFIDYITLDDGERPLLCLIEMLEGKRKREHLLRTFFRHNGLVQYIKGTEHDIPFKDSGTPTYQGLKLNNYLPIIEMLNPMHRLWSEARWNKITLAHGCYWKKCSFCDVTLDYIGRYEPASADLIIDRMCSLINETGESGFHFVDEAAPPALLRALSQRLIERKIKCTWWGNIRFEKSFTPELTNLMAEAGCIAVTGGLEVASDRLLQMMNKGVSIEQVARVALAFRDSGILVHAYLMYGFPTETVQETVDSLEIVRQLFSENVIQSAYWHRFSATIHSPIGKSPEKFGIHLRKTLSASFANNDLEFSDPTNCDHDSLSFGLKKAVYNYMHGIGLDQDVRVWFEKIRVPQTKISQNRVRQAF